MRLVRIITLSATMAIAGMALLGTSSATAGNTALCIIHESPCAVPNRVSSVHFVSSTTTLLTSLVNILCLSSLFSGTTENGGLGNPLGITVNSLTFSNCGTTAAHNNCTKTVLKPGLIDILRTALQLGTATWLGLEVLVECLISGGITLHCVYGGAAVTGFVVEGALHAGGGGHGKITGSLTLPKVSGLLCPATDIWDIVYESLSHFFLVE
jgi:hypothetical protein